MYKIIFNGNLGNDAKMKEETDFKMITFSVAVSTKKNETQWIECIYFRRFDQSANVFDYLKKGTKVLIEGEPSVEIYNEKAYLKARVINVELLGAAPAQSQSENVPF